MKMCRTLPTCASMALAATVAFAQQPVPGFADAILGRWDLTVQGADGPYPSWLEVMLRKETELMGRFVGRVGRNRQAAPGPLMLQGDHGKVSFRRIVITPAG